MWNTIITTIVRKCKVYFGKIVNRKESQTGKTCTLNVKKTEWLSRRKPIESNRLFSMMNGETR
jgi:hypothetical protein